MLCTCTLACFKLYAGRAATKGQCPAAYFLKRVYWCVYSVLTILVCRLSTHYTGVYSVLTILVCILSTHYTGV